MISIARTLGAPVTVPAGKAGPERVERVVPVAQRPAHLAHQVLHVGVALDTPAAR